MATEDRGVTIPAPVAARMVEHLFDESIPLDTQRLLCIGPAAGTLIEALESWVTDGVARSLPKCTVVSEHWDSPAFEDSVTVEAVHADDFLGGGPTFEESFEYILCVPPATEWASLTPEQRSAIADTSAHVDGETAPPSLDILYIEKALLTLAADGVGVFLPRQSLKRDDALAPYRDAFSGQALDAEPVADTANDRILVTVVGTEPTEFDGAPLSLQASPSAIEKSLASGAGRVASSLSVQNILTPITEMDGYTVSDDAAFVYLDLLYEDYDAALVSADGDPTDIRGYVSRESMRPEAAELVGDLAQPLPTAPWVPADAGIGTVIERLGQTRFAFVGTPEDVRGIVTRFDLNRFPVYQYLFDRIAQFEIGLRELIRETIDDWRDYADGPIGSHTGGDLIVDQLSQQSFGMLISIITEADLRGSIRTDWTEFTAQFDNLRNLRNTIAHFGALVHTMTDEPTLNERRRSAQQLRHEHALLTASIDGLFSEET